MGSNGSSSGQLGAAAEMIRLGVAVPRGERPTARGEAPLCSGCTCSAGQTSMHARPSTTSGGACRSPECSAWVAPAVFSRSEVESVLWDSRFPEHRCVLYALLFLTGSLVGLGGGLRVIHFRRLK